MKEVKIPWKQMKVGIGYKYNGMIRVKTFTGSTCSMMPNSYYPYPNPNFDLLPEGEIIQESIKFIPSNHRLEIFDFGKDT